MSEFLGSWKMVSVSNFDAYLKELGVNVAMRKIAALLVPTVVLTRDSQETYTMRTETMFKNVSFKYRLNEPCQETTIDDRKVESKFELDPRNPRICVQWQKDKEGRTAKITRTIRDSDGSDADVLMDVRLEVNGVASDAVFKLLK